MWEYELLNIMEDAIASFDDRNIQSKKLKWSDGDDRSSGRRVTRHLNSQLLASQHAHSIKLKTSIPWPVIKPRDHLRSTISTTFKDCAKWAKQSTSWPSGVWELSLDTTEASKNPPNRLQSPSPCTESSTPTSSIKHATQQRAEHFGPSNQCPSLP